MRNKTGAVALLAATLNGVFRRSAGDARSGAAAAKSPGGTASRCSAATSSIWSSSFKKTAASDHMFAGFPGAATQNYGYWHSKKVPLHEVTFIAAEAYMTDMIHNWSSAHLGYNGGKMDGFGDNTFSQGLGVSHVAVRLFETLRRKAVLGHGVTIRARGSHVSDDVRRELHRASRSDLRYDRLGAEGLRSRLAGWRRIGAATPIPARRPRWSRQRSSNPEPDRSRASRSFARWPTRSTPPRFRGSTTRRA